MKRSLLTGALLLGVALLISLATSAQAQADCSSPEDCYSAASWKRAIAQAYAREAAGYYRQSQQRASEGIIWRHNANQARARGDTNAAAWYDAAADRLFSQAEVLKRAADGRLQQVAYLNNAADANTRRGFLLTALFNPPPSPQEEAADAQAGGEDPDTTAVAAGTRRCRDVKNKEWNFAGVKMWISPYDFCYRKPNEVLGVSVNYGNDVLGPQDAQIDDEECSHEGLWYQWKSRGPFSGRKITVTCRWVANPAGIPINVAEMVCKARLYLHSDGSAAYMKINEGDPTCDINGPF